ncbi:MAG: tyrosine-type recombinase/integrase, partial [Actinobacteria bacterium]|nr:tyrosine-type recombinase/integrase [Actinomycetota bacterium]
LHDHKGEVLEELPKSVTSARSVALPAWAVTCLKPLRGLGPLVTEDGEPMRPWRISWLYERRVREAELRRVQFKNLRHSHACLLLDAGVDLYTVSRRLGHSTVAVTESHYVRPSERADRAAAEALRIVGQNWPRANVGQDSGRRNTTVDDGN